MVWTPAEVTDVAGPRAYLRNYLEQRDVRRFAARAAQRRPIRTAYDVGCGYGRLTPVLAEFAARVVGFERETALVAMARQLLPSLTFVETPDLGRLEAESGSADFVMTFTVLQHLSDARAELVVAELVRVASPSAHLLLVEETDPALEAGDPAHAELGYTRGRPQEWYERRLEPFRLVDTRRREIEPGYPKPDVGTYMFFEGA
jgi:SAM-dependent methyltransferase